ncbi:MAG: hypothetical protein D3908_04690 [Candidatus Electrothrix sp. AUS4]|nr:hypothetical protein [Candidatus Electrothrix sp. AUS4]
MDAAVKDFYSFSGRILGAMVKLISLLSAQDILQCFVFFRKKYCTLIGGKREGGKRAFIVTVLLGKRR